MNMDSLMHLLYQILPFLVCISSVYICFSFFFGLFQEPVDQRLRKTVEESEITQQQSVMEKKTEESAPREKAESFSVLKNDEMGAIEKSQFCFSFKFPTYEEFCRIKDENKDHDLNQSENDKHEQEEEEEEELHNNDSIKDEDELFEIEHYKEESVMYEEEEERDIAGEIKNGQQLLLEDEEAEVCSMKGPFEVESDSDSSSSIPFPRGFVVNPATPIYIDGFLSDRDFEPETPIYVEGELLDVGSSPELEMGDFNDGEGEGEENIYTMEELNEMEITHLRSMGKHENSDFLTEGDFEEEEDKRETTDKLEPLWEHQDLIEQLEMEMKKARATGLPTILEDSECPKLMEDLKVPWKIPEKYEHGDRMGEFQRLCKTYTERMRKFDILNFQKMYAIGFLQLKDPLRDVRVKRTYNVPSIRAFFSKKLENDETNPRTKFIRELQVDLEVVYIGQMCLSWEFLRWQYERVLEPWELDRRRRGRRYNHVAREFQEFCIFLERFMENEMVHGPRIHCYAKSRRILRNLLQVPIVRDDPIQKRNKSTNAIEKSEHDITRKMLVKIIEESMKTFWDFLKADKDCNIVPPHKGPREIHDFEPKDLELFVEIQKDLYKKDKHMRYILHSENSIWKMFKRNQEVNPPVYFLAQIDMRLVGRVLNMCKLTSDQLVWCRNKLNKISFVGKKIHVESSFLLFPC